MKLYQLLGVLLIVVQISHGKVLPSAIGAASISATDYGFVERMIQKLNMNNFSPINLGQMGQTLKYCQQRMETITSLIVKQYPASTTENLLTLLSTIRDVFDAISLTANTFESSLNGIVGSDVDLAVMDMQIALQVLVEAFISNCEIISGMDSSANRSDNDKAIDSAVFCLASATKTLMTSMSQLVEKIITSPEVNADAVVGLHMIIQTVLNIVDRVLYSLKRINILDLDDVEPSLEQFSLIIQRLAYERMNIGLHISPIVLSPINKILRSLKSNMDQQLPLMTRKNIENLVMALASVEDSVQDKNLSATIISLLNTLQPMLIQLSSAIRTIKGVTETVAYSTDQSLQNLLSTIKCLSFYISIVTEMEKVPTTNPTEIVVNLQPILCFIASAIQTLVDGVTAAAERALTDIMRLSSTDKLLQDKQLSELQVVLEPIFLTLENVVRTSIQLVKNILVLGASAMGESPDLVKSMNVLINRLQRIVDETLESTLTSKDANEIEDNMSVDDNALSICVTAFESIALTSIELRVYFIESIDWIRQYLVRV